MFANIDHSDPEVRGELFRWITWLGRELKLGGIRFDATKHISKAFQADFVSHIRREAGPDWLVLSEYWHHDAGFMAALVERFDHQMMLYDIPLVQRFRDLAGAEEWQVDLRTVFDSSLCRLKPENSVVSYKKAKKKKKEKKFILPFMILCNPLAYIF